jgi:hypothetical protein
MRVTVSVAIAVALALGSTSAVFAESNGDGGAFAAGGFHGKDFGGGGYHREGFGARGYREGLTHPARKKSIFVNPQTGDSVGEIKDGKRRAVIARKTARSDPSSSSCST